MNGISGSSLVHLVFINPDGTRSWFVRTDRQLNNKTGEWKTLPLVDTNARQSKSMTLDYALVARKRFLEDFGFSFRLAIEPNGAFIDEEISREGTHWQHCDYLVTVTAEGQPIDDPDSPFVYEVRAVRTIRGKEFCWKSNHPLIANQAQFSSLALGPEVAVEAAFARGYTKYEPPIANPYLEARSQQAERQAQQQAAQIKGRLRPGDRR